LQQNFRDELDTHYIELKKSDSNSVAALFETDNKTVHQGMYSKVQNHLNSKKIEFKQKILKS
jgi:hypothetical protein